MGVVMAAPPAAAVSLAEVKAYLRIGHADEDAAIAQFARSAAEYCEAYIGRPLVVRAVEERLAACASWKRLATGNVRSIDSVADADRLPLPIENYAIDIDAQGEGWVRLVRPAPTRTVLIDYRAGMAEEWNGVPEPLRQGVVRLAAHLYSHRDGEGGEPPAAATALWRPWRRLAFGIARANGAGQCSNG